MISHSTIPLFEISILRGILETVLNLFHLNPNCLKWEGLIDWTLWISQHLII